ncbi:DUF386 family protein [Candidatus Roizmanbacteria bacterium]|nr:DUF386 family protein [Candidatus Roizmanbacteria bacterium]
MSKIERSFGVNWPIEVGNHPIVCQSNVLEESIDTASIEFAFQHPDELRNIILKSVKVEPLEKFDGKSFVCVWPTKFCPVGCDMCFFHSPKANMEKKTPETTLTQAGQSKFIQFVNAANTGELVIAGGGEPFHEPDFMNQIAEQVKADKIFLTTSGIWAKSKQKAETLLSNLYDAHTRNGNDTRLDIRLSFDKFHASKISPDHSLGYVWNLLEIFREKYRDADFRLSFHTMWGDETMQELLDKLPVSARTQKNNKTELISLADGFTFEIRWRRLFYPNQHANLNDRASVKSAKDIMNEDILTEHNGNMSVVYQNNGEPSGADFLIHYDGTVLNWGATSPDNEPSLYSQEYEEVMERALSDVLSLSVLEKGNAYRDSLIEEINPKAVERAKAFNLRDFYSRTQLEESSTRLYASVRIIQDYIAEGRISQEQVHNWPKILQMLISAKPNTLIDVYNKINHNIVHQYLEHEGTTADQLAHLYMLTRLGQYNVSPQNMVETVSKSDFRDKEQFNKYVAKILAFEFIDNLSHSLHSEQTPEGETSLLLEASRVVLMNLDELRIGGSEIIKALPSTLRSKFNEVIEILLSGRLNDLPPGEYAIDSLFLKRISKNARPTTTAKAELHTGNIDIHINIGGGEMAGFNTQGTATLDNAKKDPNTEGLILDCQPTQWKTLSPGEIAFIFPHTPHALGKGETEHKIEKAVIKLSLS